MIIDDLVDQLQPVQRMRAGQAWGGIGLALIFAIGLVWAFIGLRDDVLLGQPHPMVLFRVGVLLLLGVAAAMAALASAKPGSSSNQNGWRWALAAALIVPVASLASWALGGEDVWPVFLAKSGRQCLLFSMNSAVIIGGVIVVWLRQGAPTNITRTSWMIGIAAGAFGTAAYSLHCPSISLGYAGFWYSLAVILSAVLARLTVPLFIRW